MRIAKASPQSMVLAVHAAFFVSKPAATGLNAFFKIDFNFGNECHETLCFLYCSVLSSELSF
jgi:hypothetical protein